MLASKKGLSELISIILVLGMVIALASFMILWYTDFFQATSKETSIIAAKALTCSRDVELAILEVCIDNKINIFVENKKDKEIGGNFLLIKVEGDNDIVLQPTPPGTSLIPFDKKKIAITYFPEIGNVRKVSIIPRVETSEGFVFCTDNIAETSSISPKCSN